MKKSTGIDHGLEILRQKAPSEELEYGFVMDCLKDYKNPRVKLNHLLKIGALIRVKKGIYIFGKSFTRRPYCSEVLANMIYGPSYVSLEWACQYWGLIPEKVMTVTSVTAKRSKRFETPLGPFTYDHLHSEAYPIGITLIRFSDKQQAIMATKEKRAALPYVSNAAGRSARQNHRLPALGPYSQFGARLFSGDGPARRRPTPVRQSGGCSARPGLRQKVSRRAAAERGGARHLYADRALRQRENQCHTGHRLSRNRRAPATRRQAAAGDCKPAQGNRR